MTRKSGHPLGKELEAIMGTGKRHCGDGCQGCEECQEDSPETSERSQDSLPSKTVALPTREEVRRAIARETADYSPLELFIYNWEPESSERWRPQLAEVIAAAQSPSETKAIQTCPTCGADWHWPTSPSKASGEPE